MIVAPRCHFQPYQCPRTCGLSLGIELVGSNFSSVMPPSTSSDARFAVIRVSFAVFTSCHQGLAQDKHSKDRRKRRGHLVRIESVERQKLPNVPPLTQDNGDNAVRERTWSLRNTISTLQKERVLLVLNRDGAVHHRRCHAEETTIEVGVVSGALSKPLPTSGGDE